MRDSPPGRQKVNTYLAGDERRERWWEFFRKKLREGRQGYVVVPLVEESEQSAAVSLQETYESLANGELEAFRLGLIHGRMTTEEKDAVMDRFRQGEIQVLVSTSVVEVGVDVPNATLMTIESGERFGLAQLHQLRGRISRGKYPGFCCVFAAPQIRRIAGAAEGVRGLDRRFSVGRDRLPPPRSRRVVRHAAARPAALAGGRLAPRHRFADEARRDALALVAADPGLALPQNSALRQRMLARYGKALDLGDVG